MRKTLIVARREYQTAVRSKAFVITLVLMPVMALGGLAVQVLLHGHADTTDRKIAVLDRSGALYDALAAAAERRNSAAVVDRKTGKKVEPRFLLEPAAGDETDLTATRLALSERVRRGEIFAFLEIGADVLQPGPPPAATVDADEEDSPRPGGVRYYSDTPTYDDFRRWLREPVNEEVRRQRLVAANIDPEVVRRATTPLRVESLGLLSRSATTGEVKEARRTSEAASIAVPMMLMMLMFIVVIVGSQPLMQSVLEEKMQRIAEVLLGSVSPFELMMGKLLGVVGVSFTIVGFYLIGGYVSAWQAGVLEMLPRGVMVWFVVYQALAVLMFGSLFISIGAAVTDMREAQTMVTPAMLLVVFPMFVWFTVVRQPTSTLSTLLSLFPPATPMLMVLRRAAAPNLPVWQPLLGVALVLATTIVFVLAASRIFRVGLLMQGKGARIGDMLRWVIDG